MNPVLYHQKLNKYLKTLILIINLMKNQKNRFLNSYQIYLKIEDNTQKKYS